MPEKKRALVIGANGQDGSYMLELLLEKGYEVHGTIRRSSVITTERIEHIFNKIKLHYIDITDSMNVLNIISKVKPCEIYNFSAQSHVKISSELENYTFQVNTIGVLNILQSVRILGLEKSCKIYQASTSEIMGNQTDGSIKMNELTQQSPVSVYGISKHAAQQLCNLYRDAYGLFVVNSILYNHESSRRGHNFVTQKIANHVGKYKHQTSKISPLQLGNLNARRDWGSAKLYMEAVYLMLQQEKPDNFVIATGETHSVREFVELAFKEINVDIEWRGQGVDEIGFKKGTDEILVQVNPKYYRDIDIECLIGDASKANKILGWTYNLTFSDLIKEMVSAAIVRASK
jgi:GDPmannose 4,6-dehydratase